MNLKKILPMVVAIPMCISLLLPPAPVQPRTDALTTQQEAPQSDDNGDGSSMQPPTIQAEIIATTVEPTLEPLTWEDNPSNCNQETQWIAAEAPFVCIDKVIAAEFITPTGNTTLRPALYRPDLEQIIIAKTTARWGAAQVPAMLQLVSKESGADPFAINPSSGACGIPQALPCSKLLVVIGDLSNVDGQIQWMVDYIANRYGNPSNALAFHLNHNWY